MKQKGKNGVRYFVRVHIHKTVIIIFCYNYSGLLLTITLNVLSLPILLGSLRNVGTFDLILVEFSSKPEGILSVIFICSVVLEL